MDSGLTSGVISDEALASAEDIDPVTEGAAFFLEEALLTEIEDVAVLGPLFFL
ncbi:MAG: hypothetical protein ACYDCC_08450 [Actinomycetota bacterium]